MPQFRPDLLPLGLLDTIGLPHHGLVKGGKLTTSVGEIDYRQPDDSGDTNLVRHAKSTPVSRTGSRQTLDTARGYTFKDYAILSGRTREIGGQVLGRYHWIYCDKDYSWQVSISYVASSTSLTAKVWLEKPFGLFGIQRTMTRRELASYTFSFKRYTGASNTNAATSYLHMTHSATGAVTAVNVVMSYNAYNDYRKTAQISHSFKVVLSGDGDITEGNVGEDIVATCTKLADAPDMVVTSSITTGTMKNYAGGEGLATDYTTVSQVVVRDPSGTCATLGPGVHAITETTTNVFGPYPDTDPLTGSYSTTDTVTRTFLYCVRPDAEIINVKEEYESIYTNSGAVTGAITDNPTVIWISEWDLDCDDCGFWGCSCVPTDCSVTNADGIQSLLTGTVTTDASYKLSFGDYTETLLSSIERVTTEGYTIHYDAIPNDESVKGLCAASFLATTIPTSSDSGAVYPSFPWSDTVTPIIIMSNNVIKWPLPSTGHLISILATTAESTNPYVSLEPGTGVISTDPADPICYV